MPGQSVEATVSMAISQNGKTPPFGLGAQYVRVVLYSPGAAHRCVLNPCLEAAVGKEGWDGVGNLLVDVARHASLLLRRIAGQMKDFMTQITDWLFKHPIVRAQYAMQDPLSDLSPDDIVDSLVEHARNELEKCVWCSRMWALPYVRLPAD